MREKARHVSEYSVFRENGPAGALSGRALVWDECTQSWVLPHHCKEETKQNKTGWQVSAEEAVGEPAGWLSRYGQALGS